MRSGAFLQLILALTSVAARMRTAVLELLETTRLLLSTLNKILIIQCQSQLTPQYSTKDEDLQEIISPSQHLQTGNEETPNVDEGSQCHDTVCKLRRDLPHVIAELQQPAL